MINITQEEFNQLKIMHRLKGYNVSQMQFFRYMLQKHVDQTLKHTCCGKSNFSIAKRRFFTWFLANEQAMVDQFIYIEEELEHYRIKAKADKARKAIKTYINGEEDNTPTNG